LAQIKVHRRAFERGLWISALSCDAPDWPPPGPDAGRDELERALADAWRATDGHAVLLIGRRLAQRRLGPTAMGRLRLTMLRLGLFEEALELIEQHRTREPDPWAALDRAWALAGAGRVAEAASDMACARSLDQLPDHGPQLELALRAEFDPAALEDWAQVMEAVAAGLALGLGDLAARQLASALGQAAFEPDFGLSQAQLDEALDLAGAVLRACSPGDAAVLIDALGPLYADAGLLPALDAVREILNGGEDTARAATPQTGPRDSALEALLAFACAAAGRVDAAIPRLGRLAAVGRPTVVSELARCTGSAARGGPMGFTAPTGRRRVFDVCAFDGELTLLDIRLREMAPWVDRFVIVEARRAAEPGRPQFDAVRARFADLADRIEHVVVDSFPDEVDTPVARRFFLLDCGARALDGQCGPRDLVLLSEVDEVVDGRAIAAFDGRWGICGMDTFVHFLDLRRTWTPDGVGAVVVEARFLADLGLSHARTGLQLFSGKSRIPGAGWRFTSLPVDGAAGGPERERLLAALQGGQTLSGFERIAPEAGLPASLIGRRAELEGLFLPG
jgi:hypothetical protein